EQEVSLNLTEPLSFVEVFSEQRLKLLSLAVTSPPSGAFDQETSVALSDDRELEASVRFTGTWPVLRVVYRDPFFNEFEAPLGAKEQLESFEPDAAVSAMALREALALEARRRKLLESIRSSVLNARFWLRPGTVTVVFAVFVFAVSLFVITLRRSTPPSPS